MERFSDEDLERLLSKLRLEEKVLLLTGRDSWSLHPLPSIGLRSIVVSDGPVGVRGDVWDERSPSANFPSPTALAATWDRAAVRTVGRGLGSEARRKSIDVVLAPTVNLHRSPYGGRHFEAFSEDPLLTAELAGEYVRGIQEYGVGATLKHYVANESETERFTADMRVDERTLRELYLLAFESPVTEAGSWLVMSSYNSINGVTASENELLSRPLNDEWGFDGVVISDWTAVRSLESARQAQDLAMPGPTSPWSESLLEAVHAGEVSEAAIDRKVLRILRLAARVGALNGFGPDVPAPPGARTIARTVAISGSVLLSNNGILPLPPSPSIALIGEGARFARTQGGGSATVIPEAVVSPVDGLRRRFGDDAVAWARGAVVDQRPSPLPLTVVADLSGAPGVSVRYLDPAGAELGRETRRATTIVSFEGTSMLTRAATVEMSFRYTPSRPGSASLAVIGLCDFEVHIDGAVATTGSIRLRPGDDFATAVLTPPFTTVDVQVAAEGSDVVVRFTPVPGGVPDAAALGVGSPAPDLAGDALIAEASALAASREVAVVVVSTSAEVESEGFDRQTLALPGRQDDLVRAVVAANPRTIVVVNTGAPVVLPWRDEVAAVLAVWFPGQEFGDALAAIFSGDAEPGGRLPTTWPSAEEEVPVSAVTPVEGRLDYAEGIHVGHRAWLAAGRAPAYPFGHGLGYTTWAVDSIEAPAALEPYAGVPVAATIRNTGARRGKAVVQFYLERVSASGVDRPVRWLAQFETADLAAGEARTVETTIRGRRFAHWADGWTVEPGTYRVVAALDVADPGKYVDLVIG